MLIHEEILLCAQRLADEEGRFRLADLVKALPRHNSNTVRTQVTSYCCVNAEQHHAHRQPYFRRVGFGRYQLEPKHRKARRPLVARDRSISGVVHAFVTQADGVYTAECHEIAVVTQGRSVEDALANLREAIALHLDGEDPEETGILANPRISVTFEMAL